MSDVNGTANLEESHTGLYIGIAAFVFLAIIGTVVGVLYFKKIGPFKCTPKCPEDTCGDDTCGNTCPCSDDKTCNSKKKCVKESDDDDGDKKSGDKKGGDKKDDKKDDDDKKGDDDKSEVYYYDNAGTNETRYKLSYDDAVKIAKAQKAKIATPAQLEKAQKAGADSCWIGWASDKNQYIPSNSNWDEGNPRGGSGCPGPKLYDSKKDFDKRTGAGVYLYGIRPSKTDISDCTDPGVTTKCVVPWSKTKWSSKDD